MVPTTKAGKNIFQSFPCIPLLSCWESQQNPVEERMLQLTKDTDEAKIIFTFDLSILRDVATVNSYYLQHFLGDKDREVFVTKTDKIKIITCMTLSMLWV